MIALVDKGLCFSVYNVMQVFHSSLICLKGQKGKIKVGFEPSTIKKFKRNTKKKNRGAVAA